MGIITKIGLVVDGISGGGTVDVLLVWMQCRELSLHLPDE